MSKLDEIAPQLITTDTRKKMELGIEIISVLEGTKKVECEDISHFIDSLVPWIQSSNFKIGLNGLTIVTLLIERMKEDFRHYVVSIVPATVDRLGDSKDVVRTKSQGVLSALMEHVLPPAQLFEKLVTAFSHKNGKVREEIMLCLQYTLNEHGASAVIISKLLPQITKLLSDPVGTVRDCAFNTLVETYKHYGERLRLDLNKKYPVPSAKLPSLMQRFDEVRDTGLLLNTASTGDGRCGDDEADRASVKSAGSKFRASSAPPARRLLTGVASAPPKTTGAKTNTASRKNSFKSVKRTPSVSRRRQEGTAAGAVDEATFFQAFQDVPKVAIYSARDLESTLTKIRECIHNTSNEWDKRVEALKKIRSVVVAGGPNYEEFYSQIRLMEPAMQLSIKDLRSQVVREACISVAFMSQELHTKVDHFCEMVLPPLVNLIQNTTKIMASAAVVAIRFIIQNTHHHKLIPILTKELNTKSREIRRAICEFLDQLLHTWSAHSMERHVLVLSEAIKKGITDADPEARAFSRKAYWGFADHFKDEADKLLHSLDPSYKKMLQGDMTTSTSAQSLPSTSRSHHKPATHRLSRGSHSAAGSTENLASGPSSLSGMHRIPTVSHRPPRDSPGTPVSMRSNSAIDLQAARRAQARSQYAQAQRLKIGSGVSLPRARKLPDHLPIKAAPISDRSGRPRTKGMVSQSQPGSRSGSPSSRLSYATYNSPSSNSTFLGRMRMRSGIPRSTGTSREQSPNRLVGFGSSYATKPRNRSISGASDIPPQTPNRHRQPNQRILQQSREAAHALADALITSPTNSMRSPRKLSYSRTYDDHSDESETSSICSDRSFDSYRRNDFNWYGSQQRILKSSWDMDKAADVNEIIMKSASTHWADRKEGLVSLFEFLRGSNVFTKSELSRITDLFTKMFMDTHTKVFSLFLDTLLQLIIVHHEDLHDWLYILLTKLLNKLGADLLGSVQTKIHRTLDLIRDSFPCDLQFQVLMRFITDATQTPNTKVKVATLTYLKCLVDVMSPADLSCYSDTPSALTKILLWTADQKSVEIRRAASASFIAMFNCNMTELTHLVQKLTPACQSTASLIIQNHLKRAASLDASPSSLPPRTPPSLGGTPPVLQSPNTSFPKLHRTPRYNPVDDDDTENLNPDEIFKSLKRTTDEIRNYSFEHDSGFTRRISMEKQKDASSQDSGISQLSNAMDYRGVDVVDHKADENHVFSGRSSKGSSPTHRNMSESSSRNTFELEEEFSGLDIKNESDIELMSSIISELTNNDGDRLPEKRDALSSLVRLARTGSTVVWNEHFRMVLRLLLERLNNETFSLRDVVLRVLTEMMRRYPLVQHFLKFSELIILRVLKAQGDKVQDVQKAAQCCSGTVAEILPPDVVIRVLKPLIQMGEYPLNQAAIKMLNKLVEAHNPTIVTEALPEIMPGLLKAYDNEMSPVRKAAVFCMVSIYTVVGQDIMKPYLQSLSVSKLKLLNLYMKRAESQNSGASSPKSDML